jgi:hypothetical protein
MPCCILVRRCGSVLSLIALVVKLGVPERYAKLVLFAVLAFGTLTILGLAKCAYDRNVIQKHEAGIQQRAKPATDKAADERARDTIAQAKNEEEAHNAVHSVPDAAPAGPSHALACQRLHKLGRHPASCG